MTTATAGDAPSSIAAEPAAPVGQGTPPAPAATPNAAPANPTQVSASQAPAAPAVPPKPSLLDPASVLPPKGDTATPAKDSTAPQTDQPKSDAKASAVVELKLPADAKLDASALDSVKALAATHKLAPEIAQAVLDHGNALVKGYEDSVKAAWAERSSKWIDFVKADADVGGEKFATSLENVARATARFCEPAFVQELKDAGLDSHPGLFKAFARIGEAMRDDRIDAPGGGGGNLDAVDALEAAYRTSAAPK